MSVTLLSENKRVARREHQCGYCFRFIQKGERYLDQRCADDGRAWTWRAHLDCHSAYWSWCIHEDDGSYELTDLTEGHLPPCRWAWAKTHELPANEAPPCLCDRQHTHAPWGSAGEHPAEP